MKLIINLYLFDYYRYFDVYTMCVPDRMHHADLGLFQYQLRFTVELLNLKCGSSSIKILEERLSKIPRYPNLKIFKSGFERLNRLTASEYRDLMKVMLFVVDNLYNQNTNNTEDYVENIPDKSLSKLE